MPQLWRKFCMELMAIYVHSQLIKPGGKTKGLTLIISYYHEHTGRLGCLSKKKKKKKTLP